MKAVALSFVLLSLNALASINPMYDCSVTALKIEKFLVFQEITTSGPTVQSSLKLVVVWEDQVKTTFDQLGPASLGNDSFEATFTATVNHVMKKITVDINDSVMEEGTVALAGAKAPITCRRF